MRTGAAVQGIGLARSDTTVYLSAHYIVLAVAAKHEAKGILRRELNPQARPKRVNTERAQMLVEVCKPGQQGRSLR